jgi:hypothetical protein
MTRRLLCLAVVTAAAAGAVSVATATIPDGSGVIHACYSLLPQTGQLRVIDTARAKSCGRNEKPLSWNQQGRTGTTGPTGPSGTSTSWFRQVSGTAPKTPSVLLALSLPAGTFMVTLTGEGTDAGGDGWVRVRCSVTEARGIAASAFVTGQAASLASSGVVSLASPGKLDVECDSDPLFGSLPDGVDIQLSAIQTDNAHVE